MQIKFKMYYECRTTEPMGEMALNFVVVPACDQTIRIPYDQLPKTWSKAFRFDYDDDTKGVFAKFEENFRKGIIDIVEFTVVVTGHHEFDRDDKCFYPLILLDFNF